MKWSEMACIIDDTFTSDNLMMTQHKILSRRWWACFPRSMSFDPIQLWCNSHVDSRCLMMTTWLPSMWHNANLCPIIVGVVIGSQGASTVTITESLPFWESTNHSWSYFRFFVYCVGFYTLCIGHCVHSNLRKTTAIIKRSGLAKVWSKSSSA